VLSVSSNMLLPVCCMCEYDERLFVNMLTNSRSAYSHMHRPKKKKRAICHYRSFFRHRRASTVAFPPGPFFYPGNISRDSLFVSVGTK